LPGQNLTGIDLLTGNISKIQKYSTKDGPGIRSTVFCVGCNLRCVWCSNPELIESENKILYYGQRCVGCGACVALSNGTISAGAAGCKIDRERCANLAECAAACNYDAYEKIGRTITARELVNLLLRDKVFYDQSKGGVTFSGGEPALQPEFIAQAAALLREAGVHSALDTAGCIEWNALKIAAEQVDLILYDIKAFDDDIHRSMTGVSNALILENARQLAKLNKTIHIRLIPL
jgi:pyruvate formate lyase activating enzyme